MEVKKSEENCHPDDEPIVMTPRDGLFRREGMERLYQHMR